LKQVLTPHPVEVRIPDDVPPTVWIQHASRRSRASARECRQVFGVDAAIRLPQKSKNETLITSIADRGPGIDDLEQALIFDKFYRGRNQRVRVHELAWD